MLQSGVIEKGRLMLLLNLLYNKMTDEVKNSLASPRRCMTFAACQSVSVNLLLLTTVCDE